MKSLNTDSAGEQFFEPTEASPTKSSKRQRTDRQVEGENHDDDESSCSEGPETSDRFRLGGPSSTSTGKEKDDTDKTEQHCPVCSRTLVTDNRGLNEHIDFCLSRDAIREARSSAGTR